MAKAKLKSQNISGTIIQEIKKVQQRLERISSLKIEEYEKYVDGKISKDAYVVAKELFNDEESELSGRIRVLESEIELQKNPKNEFVEHFKGKQRIEELSRELVAELVDSIYVFDENRIEIVWNFADEYGGVV